MSFARPELLLLALLAIPELLLGLKRSASFRASLELLAGPARRAAASSSFRALSLASTISAALFVVSAAIALAGPSWGLKGAPVERRGLEAAMVLDVSRSMLVRDGDVSLAETRLGAAKGIVAHLVGSGSESSFSLIVAKGDGVLLAPMTEDEYALGEALAYAGPDAMSAAGTNLESALKVGLSSFSSSGAQGRLLFLFTDGGELSGSAKRGAEELARSGVRLVIVGMGGSVPMPVPGPDGSPLVGKKGIVRSALEASSLRALAAVAGGRYLEASDSGAKGILETELSRASGKGTRIEYRSVDRAYLFALLALAFLAAAILSSLLAPIGARA